jgi:L-lactate dehydrogenase complex protein LldG
MNSREAILQALRSQQLPEQALPELEGPFTHYPNLEAQFIQALERAAGTYVRVLDGTGLGQVVAGLPRVGESRRICSLASEVPGNVPLTLAAHRYDDVDVLIARADFGVAENGALWFTDAGSKQRSVFFLTQHVIALLDSRQLVHNMHEAYQRLQVEKRPFGCFVAGPSKTADIEQALVVGAHGPRSLTVVLD